MTQDEYEALIAQGLDPEDINKPGGMNLGGLPNVGGGPPGNRNQLQRQAVNRLQSPQSAPERPQEAIRSPFHMPAYGVPSPMMNGLMSPAEQGQHLAGMVAQVNNAYHDENDSRVAQAREERRMQQERDMESMRQESLLRRLEVEQEERNKDRILQKQLQSGVTTRQFINGQWVDV
jgi:hypothetical protein